MAYLQRVERLDFRIPAKVVLVAAILLRMKIDYLFGNGKEELLVEEVGEEEMKRIDFAELQSFLKNFNLPVVRRPVRKVTLDELIQALRKALKVEERRRERKLRIRKSVESAIEISHEDIEAKLNKLLAEIEDLLAKFKTNVIPFKQLVPEWKRELIIDRFIPLLHLDFRRKVDAIQEKPFDEIIVRKVDAS